MSTVPNATRMKRLCGDMRLSQLKLAAYAIILYLHGDSEACSTNRSASRLKLGGTKLSEIIRESRNLESESSLADADRCD
jgi:hypothetical protein